eukprot:4526780-Amphidinium_carterae.2
MVAYPVHSTHWRVAGRTYLPYSAYADGPAAWSRSMCRRRLFVSAANEPLTKQLVFVRPERSLGTPRLVQDV